LFSFFDVIQREPAGPNQMSHHRLGPPPEQIEEFVNQPALRRIARDHDIRERSFLFACDVVRFCRDARPDPTCRRIIDQLLDAGTSVGANAAEAKSAYTRSDFAYKNGIALKEARESVFWLRLIIACRVSTSTEATRPSFAF
jgi:four helix bundle protein